MHHVSLAIQTIERDGFRQGNPYALTVRRVDLVDSLTTYGIPALTAEAIATAHDRDGRSHASIPGFIVATF